MCGSCCGGWTFLSFVCNAAVSKRSALPRFNLRWRRSYPPIRLQDFGDLCATVSFPKNSEVIHHCLETFGRSLVFPFGIFTTLHLLLSLYFTLIVKILLCNRYIYMFKFKRGLETKTKTNIDIFMYVDIALTAVVQWNKARGVKRQKKNSPCCSVSVDGFCASSSPTDNSLLHVSTVQFVVTASHRVLAYIYKKSIKCKNALGWSVTYGKTPASRSRSRRGGRAKKAARVVQDMLCCCCFSHSEMVCAKHLLCRSCC